MPLIRRVPLLLLALVLLAPAVVRAEPGVSTDRWYEILRNGQKYGHSRVVWAPSTWEGRPTVHDTTTIVERSIRNMMGIRDVFETVTTIDLERGDDGTLWWLKVAVEEANRVTTEETRWTGSGYERVSRLGEAEERVVIPLEEPVMTDSEAFLGSRVRARTVKVGDTFDLRLLDVTARSALVTKLEIVAREEVEDGAQRDDEGQAVRVPCFRVQETDPRSGSASTMWIDDDGAFVKIVAEGGITYRRLAREEAEKPPVNAAEYTVTTPSTPALERVMSADRLYVDLHLRPDPDRPLPEFPTSRFSRQVGVRGSDEEGWVVELVLDKFDEPDATATLPMVTEGLERHLESTVLMPIRHERIQAVVKDVVGDEKDARKAAYALARYVYSSLGKKSPDVGQASALEILEAGYGDCSEHALLFVTLCRAAGIPARQCSGYVNIGSQWGAHAWAEVWLGRWVGADPTTGEIGTGARYLFFGYHDDPDSFPGLVSSRARGRMRFVATRIVEGDDDYDLRDAERWRLHDDDARRYVHVLAGIDMREVPRDWVVRLAGASRAHVRGPGFRVDIQAFADQGGTLEELGGAGDTFAGAPAFERRPREDMVAWLVHSRRRFLQIVLRLEEVEDPDAVVEQLEHVLAPTCAPRPTAPAKADPPPQEGPK